jgi:copper transport protein
VLVLLLTGLALGTAAPASAHPTLLFTDPVTDTGVPESPPVITLVFNEAVTIGPRAVALLDSEGRPAPVGDATAARDGHVVTARPAGTLAAGTYVVRWQVTGSDGDQAEEEFRFAVGTAISGAGTSGRQLISWAGAVLRWLLFAGLAVALGGVVGERFTASARAENPRLCPLRSWVVPATVLGLAGVTGLGAVLIADTGTASTLWQGRAGQLLLAEAAGLAVALPPTVIRSGRWRGWAALPLTAVIVAEGLRSHANVATPGWGALLTGLHLAAVAVWVGALVQVARAALAWRRERAALRWVLAGYVRLALGVFIVVVSTGTVTALLLVRPSTVLSTIYGQVLLLKFTLVAVAAGLALSARLTLRRRQRLDRVGTLVRVESSVLVGVLAVSAVLVSTPPAGSQQPGPPPPRGPVVPLGALAGQVGVSVQASDGQLVVRLTTPRRGDYYAPQPEQDYTLSGRLTAQRESRAVEFRGCGDGCFVSTVDWNDGDNVLTLRAAAASWRGGTVSLLVPWPPQPGAEDLGRGAAALRAADHVTVYEAVTSDTTIDLPAPRQLDLTGEFFVSTEPYAAGTAPTAVRISRPGRPIRLALGYPAVFTNVQLTLDARGRISEETLTDDSHLVHRRFVYPDHD